MLLPVIVRCLCRYLLNLDSFTHEQCSCYPYG